MRLRILASATAIALTIGLLSSLPASAAYTVESITFPGGGAEFYSPFGGPATIEFGFLGSENNATFNVRIRPANGSTFYDKDVFVTPDEADGTETETFSWPPITVSNPKEYIVSVHRFGDQIDSQSFFLHPRLVRITDIAPDPFFPWRTDGYKDETTVKFALAQAADAEARIFKANPAGKCCGSLILDEDLGNQFAGPNTWAWDGRGEGEHGTSGFRPKGSYFVKIRADDHVIAPAISKPFKVRIARTYRATATKTKPGTQYARTTESALVRGGDCLLHNLGALQVDCHGARITVYYRWGLNSEQRIEKASFVIDNSENECGLSRRKTGHTKHESFITVTDAVSGITSCRIVTAKITYSFPEQS